MSTSTLQAHIEARSIPEPNSGCWLWLLATDKKGYGRTSINRQAIRAHRASWMAFNGPIPAGLHVLHRCDFPICVNPEHLWVGTHTDNVRDCLNKGRHRSNNKSGDLVGATYLSRSGMWQAQIRINSQGHYLGVFPTREEATAAYWAARCEAHPNETRRS